MPEYRSLQKDYVKCRIERAKEELEAVHLLFEAGNLPDKWQQTGKVVCFSYQGGMKCQLQ